MYRRLGRKYWVVLAIGQGAVSIFVAVVTLGGVALFLRPSLDDLLIITAIGLGADGHRNHRVNAMSRR